MMTADQSLQRIGSRLRERRRLLGLTLDDVANRAGLTKGFLSEIERDRTSPSVASLVRICDVLALPVGSLFAGPAAAVVRVDARAPIAFGGHRIQDFQITPTGATRILCILSQMQPGGGGGEAKYSVKCEEEFVFVLVGRVRVEVDDEIYDLGPGDALTFDPRRPHTFGNGSKVEPAEAIFVLSPPIA